jgi:uncharacterized protein YjdB
LSADPLDQFGNPYASAVAYTSSNDLVATVDANGLVTAIAQGQASITASNGAVAGICDITVSTLPVLTHITMSLSSGTRYPGQSQVVDVQTIDQFGNNIAANVTFTSSDQNVVTAGPNAGMPGTFIIQAMALGGPITVTASAGGLSTTANITVVPQPVLNSITVSPSTAAVVAGKTQQLAARTIDQFGNDIFAAVNWTSSDAAVATVNNGVVTAVALGTATISAVSGNVSGQATITVTPLLVLGSITVNPATATTVVGQTQQFAAQPLDQFGNSIAASITWTTSDSAIATISGSGLLSAIAAGPVTVTATSGAVAKTSSVTVEATTPQIILDISSPADVTAGLPATWQVTYSESEVVGLVLRVDKGDPISPDSAVSGIASFTYTFATPGQHTMTFIATGPTGTVTMQTIIVYVREPQEKLLPFYISEEWKNVKGKMVPWFTVTGPTGVTGKANYLVTTRKVRQKDGKKTCTVTVQETAKVAPK